jgi:glycosyltransferase involved in cell wall biosynthesis
MRVCLISREFPPDTGWGGIATFVHDLALGLTEIGHRVDVIALSADETEKSVDYDGVTVHRVAWQRGLSDKQRLLTAVPYTHNILKQILPLWQKFQELNAVEPFDVVETPEMFAEGLFAAMSKCTPLVVRLYTPHFKFIDDNLHNITAEFDHQFIATLERLTMLAADVVTSPSEDLADYVCRDLNYARELMPIVRDPVNTQKFCPAGNKALAADGRLTVLFAGRLEARKGVHTLMAAIPKVLQSFPNVRFVLLGRDTNTAPGKKSVLAELQKSLRQSHCTDNVIFIPGVPNFEMPAYFRSADVCVLPSLYDNAPFTCIEALSSGVPVVGTSAGGMKEYVVDGKSGWIVPPSDADALAEALLKLLADDDQRHKFGAYAREHVLSNFDRKEIARQSVELYKQAANTFSRRKNTALYRHPQADLSGATLQMLGSFEQMLYDLLYRESWRFRLSHWIHALRDRPRLMLAKGIVAGGKVALRIVGSKTTPEPLRALETAILNKHGPSDRSPTLSGKR